MNKENHDQNIKFEGQGYGCVFGNNNIIYNYFDKKKEVIDKKDNLQCPYRGLFSFSPNDEEYFFGRDDSIGDLLEAVKSDIFVPVLGASGSGKSSLVLAGLVPELVKNNNWQFTHFRPGDEPFHSLATALIYLHQPKLNEVERLKQSRVLAGYLKEGSVQLKDVFAQIENNFSKDRVLLIADQFEELFTLCTRAVSYT
ncbi:MAG: WD40 repeat domain-containing protein, partial [Xenococcus sp. (in: cyanobacteria)]